VKSLSLAALALGLVLSFSPAGAQHHPNTDAAAIRAQQSQIRSDAQARIGRYKDMSETKRLKMFEHQDRVEHLTAGISQTTELGENDQIVLFNALEAIEALVNQAENERMVCRRIKPVGSNRPTTVCRTVAQLREDREEAERNMMRRGACASTSGC
jgi:multidrug resistance efflux pump